jgi:hypothetical protein
LPKREQFIEKIYNGKRLDHRRSTTVSLVQDKVRMPSSLVATALGYRPPVEFERSLLTSPLLTAPEQVTA